MSSGRARVIDNEVDLSQRPAAKRGVHVAMAIPLVRGPLEPTLFTSGEEFVRRCTPYNAIKVGYDNGYFEALTTFGFTSKIWVSRAVRNARYPAAYIRAAGATGVSLAAEFGMTDPTSQYDLMSKDGRPQIAPGVVTFDGAEDWLTVPAAVYALLDTGDTLTLSSTGTLPLPLVSGSTYYAIKTGVANKVALATSKANANAGQRVDITSFGLGAHTLTVTGKAKSGTFSAGASDVLTVSSTVYAALDSGDRVAVSTAGTLPAGLGSGPYYVAKLETANSIKLCAAPEGVEAGTFVDITDAGSGAHTIVLSDKEVTGAVTVDMNDDALSVSNVFYENLRMGDPVRLHISVGGELPVELTAEQRYYAIKLPQAGKIKLATTKDEAVNGVGIAMTAAGTGTATLSNEGISEDLSSNRKLLLITAADPGAWGNDLSVRIRNYVGNETAVREPDAFLIDVYMGTARVESLLCSRDVNKKSNGVNIYVEDVARRSSYIRVIDNVAIDPATQPKDQVALLALAGGTDGEAVTDAVMVEAIQKYKDVDSYPVAIVPDSGWTTPAFQTAIVDVCETRGDCAFVFSTPFQAEAEDSYKQAIVDYKTETLNSVSSYGGIWSPHLKVTDTENNREIYIAPSAHVAGKIAYCWDVFEPWLPAAGNRRGVLNVLGVNRTFTDGDQDYLYDNNVNPIRWKRGKGTVIWGQKTLLSTPSDLDRMNARLLLCVIKPALKGLLEDFLFQLNTVENDTGTRAQIRAVITNYMESVQARGGVYGFKVICDDTNNTKEDVASNTLRVWLLVKIVKSIEYIPFTIGIVGYNVDFDLAATLL